MKSPRLLWVVAAALVLTAALAMPSAAAGGTMIFRTDGNDTPGPLDLASLRLTPIDGGDRFQLKTQAKFTTSQLNGKSGWFELGIDTNADRDPNFIVFVYYYNGKLFALLVRGSTLLRHLPVHRVDKRTVSFDLKHSALVGKDSYDFVALSIWKGTPCSKSKPCVDGIPNRYPLIRHDFTAPTIDLGDPIVFTTDDSAELPFGISFKVRDDEFGSGVKAWRFQSRDHGTTSWTLIQSGTTKSPTVHVPGTEGLTYDYRVIAVDKQGNKRTTKARTATVPFDDRNAMFQYTTGAPTLNDGVTSAFLGTTSSLPSTATLTATITLSGQYVCLIGAPTPAGTHAHIVLSVDGSYEATLDEHPTTNVRQAICTPSGVTGSTISLTTSSTEPFIFDGLGVMP
jgi:hypothetical protein